MRLVGPWKEVVERVLGAPYGEVVTRRVPTYVRPPGYWSAEQVLIEIADRVARGRSLQSRVVQREDGSLLLYAGKFWGSWERALREAGLDYDRIRVRARWDRDRILEAIRDRRRRGVSLLGSNAQRDEPGLWSAARRVFGSWASAVREAGCPVVEQVEERLPALTTGPRREREAAAVVATIERLAGKGVRRTEAGVRGAYRELCLAAIRTFGTWGAARRAAGIEVARLPVLRKWTRESILSAIRDRKEAALPLDYASVRRDSSALVSAAETEFRGWYEALREPGIDPGRWRRYRSLATEEEILEAIAEWLRKIPLAELRERPSQLDRSLHRRVLAVFGGWDRALREVVRFRDEGGYRN